MIRLSPDLDVAALAAAFAAGGQRLHVPGVLAAEDAETIAAFGRLMHLATVVTPNAPELEALGGIEALPHRGGPVREIRLRGDGGREGRSLALLPAPPEETAAATGYERGGEESENEGFALHGFFLQGVTRAMRS